MKIILIGGFLKPLFVAGLSDGHKAEACMFEHVKRKKESLQPEENTPELVELKAECTPAPLSRWERAYFMTCGKHACRGIGQHIEQGP